MRPRRASPDHFALIWPIALALFAGACTARPSDATDVDVAGEEGCGQDPELAKSGQIAIARAAAAQAPIIIDHTTTDLSRIPSEWILRAKETLRVGYSSLSHGSQVITGLKAMRGQEGSLYYLRLGYGPARGASLDYNWSDDGPGAVLAIGRNGSLAWRDKTIELLDDPRNDRNVVIWSWCSGVSDGSPEGTNTFDAYLPAMNELEQKYPNVRFVYMTGHLDGTGAEGILAERNERIRDTCRRNNKILFDFADIESYDPDGNVNYMPLSANEGCWYDSDGDHSRETNWARQWVDANPTSPLTQIASQCGPCAHSEKLNCVLKARAFWWLMARLAGWDGGQPTGP